MLHHWIPCIRVYPVFLGMVGVYILFSSSALQPAQAQETLPAMNLVGNAHLSENRLRLTLNEQLQTGAGWLVAKQQIASGFTVELAWEIVRANPRRGAEGFAVVLHNADGQPFPSIMLGEGRHGLGYQGIPNSLAVEFDTVMTPPADFGGGKGDPNGNHVSVQSRGQLPNSANTDFSLGFTTQTAPAVPLFTSGRHTARIVYAPPEDENAGNIAVFLDQQAAPVLNANVDLATLLRLDNGTAWVGVTAATGRRFQAHDILSFSFISTEQTTPTPAPTPTPEPGVTSFSAHLDGSQEVPERETQATGEATFEIRDESQIDFSLTVADIENLIAAHIHCAPAGETGAIGITLFGPVAPGGGAVDAFATAGTITEPDANNDCGWADMGDVSAAIQDGDAYVNVHTDDGEDPPDTGAGDFPDGEIRGQITAQ
jgi:CHRD domain/Legume lectin domain